MVRIPGPSTRSRTMRLWRPIVSLLRASVISVAPGVSGAQEKIRLGILPFSESLGAVMADKLGYFKAEGLDVEMVKINSGAQGMPLLQSGKLEIVFTNTVSTLQAIEQGMDATLIAPGAVVRTQA